jgi:hypothetical protein
LSASIQGFKKNKRLENVFSSPRFNIHAHIEHRLAWVPAGTRSLRNRVSWIAGFNSAKVKMRLS